MYICHLIDSWHRMVGVVSELWAARSSNCSWFAAVEHGIPFLLSIQIGPGSHPFAYSGDAGGEVASAWTWPFMLTNNGDAWFEAVTNVLLKIRFF
jgi:hypothetical protein